MKKLFLLLIILMITLSGCSFSLSDKDESQPSISSKDSAPQYTETHTGNDVITAFQAAGLKLVENQTLNPADFLIDDITPVIYSLKQSDQFFLLYDYKSIAKRKEAQWAGDDYYGFGSRHIPHKESWYSRSIYTKNFVIFYMVDKECLNQQNYSAYTQLFTAIKKVLYNLNNAKTMIFADQSCHFDANCKVAYYQHWYINDQDQIGVDQYSNGKWQVKYLGSNPESFVGEGYEYQHPGGGGRRTDDVLLKKFDQGYYLDIGNIDSSHIPDKDSVYTLTIKWNGQQETLHLQAVPQYSEIPANSPFDANFLKYPALCKYTTPPYSSF